MLGIGHRLERQTKQKILGHKAMEYNTKFQELTSNGANPDEAIETLNSENFSKRHFSSFDS